MRAWLQIVVLVLLVGGMSRILSARAFDDPSEWRSCRAAASLLRRLRRRPEAEVVPLRRPIERVCADLRRLHAAFHLKQMRFAKYEGCRLAYDGVLAEAADMLGVTHLIRLLPPGTELDRERERVEWLLEQHGLLRPPWAA
ncbi:MAG TPA: hypothetical protein VLK03_08645 [Nocardioides sp.]|nr:hypothetical protein [Nocardioides sp.]